MSIGAGWVPPLGWQPPPGWSFPVWQEAYNKHHPEYNRAWDATVRSTSISPPTAKYNVRLTLEQIRDLEMDCVTGQGIEIQPQGKPHVRVFWREVNEVHFSVGASSGSETTCIYVEYHNCGAVHGRPMTLAELKRKGA